MENRYIDIPSFTTLKDISSQNYSLSARQYKTFCIRNSNVRSVGSFLDRDLSRSDLGSEVGSDSYIENAPYLFIKTKALQPESFLLDEGKDSTERIVPKCYIDMHLKEGDILISKDSNVGEIVILDKDYPNAMLCGGIYRLPVTKNKYYLLAFIKSELFRQQIDFLVPRGSTIRHGKTKFLDCLIPLPNDNVENTIQYIEILTKAIINKEKAIRNRYQAVMSAIQTELESNQKDTIFHYELPTIEEIQNVDRMDSSLYTREFKEKEFLITNYKFGTSSITDDTLDFRFVRGNNLAITCIGRSIYSDEHHPGFYTLILPKNISKYGTMNKIQYLGNKSDLIRIKPGAIVFGAEGNEKGRSWVAIDANDDIVTNFHGLTLYQKKSNVQKSIFIKLFLDYYRAHGMIDSYATGGNGGSLSIKYWNFMKFPNFPEEKEKAIVELYHSHALYDPSECTLDSFLSYDDAFNRVAGIYELDKSLNYLREKLQVAIDDIANDTTVDVAF